MPKHFHPGRHTSTEFISINTHLCKACWACVETCSRQVIDKVEFFNHKHAHISQKERCKGCFKCVRVCPNGAISAIERQNEKEYAHLLG